MFSFNRARRLAFGASLGPVFFSASFGLCLQRPGLGSLPFLAGLMTWYIPSPLFAWTGWFADPEFGAAPTGRPGLLLMLPFYAQIAFLPCRPFGRFGEGSP